MLRNSFPLIEELEEFAVFLSNAISHILGENESFIEFNLTNTI